MPSYIIEENDSNRRVDRLVRRLLKDVPICFIYSSIRKGKIRLNGKKTKGSVISSLGDSLYVDDELLSIKKPSSPKTKLGNKNKCSTTALSKAKNSEMAVLFQNEHLLFINKIQGVPTHGKGSIDDKVKKNSAHLMSLSFCVGALHRLDKDTTGIISFSQSLKGAQVFSKAMQEKKIDRYYIGINEGKVESGQWKIKDSNNAFQITNVCLLEYSFHADFSLCLYKLVTGKKHQIRKGAAYFHEPLFCDRKYGSKRKDYSTYFLHSFMLHFTTPLFLDIPNPIIAPLPFKFLKMINLYFPNTAKKMTEHLYYDEIKKIAINLFR